jgi:hypothetical protein
MSKEDVFGQIESPSAQDVSNFLWRACDYIQQRRPHELMTIQILREKCYDVMDAHVGAERAKAVN